MVIRDFNVVLSIEEQIDKTNLQYGEQLLKEKKEETATIMSLLLKYHRTLPKIKEIVVKHWLLLHINPNLAEIFQNLSILAFPRKKTSATSLVPN